MCTVVACKQSSAQPPSNMQTKHQVRSSKVLQMFNIGWKQQMLPLPLRRRVCEQCRV